MIANAASNTLWPQRAMYPTMKISSCDPVPIMGAQSNISMAFPRMLRVTELVDFRVTLRYTGPIVRWAFL